MGLIFPWVPDRVTEEAPEFANLVTPSYRFKEQRANLAEQPKRVFRLFWDRATQGLRDKLIWHYLYHRGTYESFTWREIPSYVQTPNLILPSSQCFIAAQDASQYWAAVGGSVITLTQGVAGPDGELNATRVQATAGGGTDATKYQYCDTRANALSGQSYRVKGYARKYASGSQDLTIVNHCSDATQVIDSTSWEEITITGSVIASNTRRIYLQAPTAAGTIDAILAYPAFFVDELAVRWVSFKQESIPPRWRIEAMFQEVL